MLRLYHPRSRDSQCQETFLEPSADNRTRNYDIECSHHNPSLGTLRSKGLNHSKMKWWAIYTNLPVNAIGRLPHPQKGDCQSQKTFLAPSAHNHTRNYNTECSNHHPSLSTLRSMGLSRSRLNVELYRQIYQ